MFHTRIGRSAAVLALVSGAALTIAPLTNDAGAAGTGITCAKLSGNVNKSVKASLCTGNTGGASKPIAASTLGAGHGTITWVNGKKTGIKFTTSTTEHDGGEAKKCAATTQEIEVKGSVTSDNTGSTHVGAGFSAEVCYNAATGAINLEPGTKSVIKP
jgi:hypothetical protein